MFDNAAELLHLAGRSLPHAMAMLIPEAWDQDPTMNPDKRAFYEYHASLMEPWDGPAAIAFTDGRVIGATLDRNGLRPARWLVTARRPADHGLRDGRAAHPARVDSRQGPAAAGQDAAGGPGRGPDRSRRGDQGTACGRGSLTASGSRRTRSAWTSLPEPPRWHPTNLDTIMQRQRAFGYTEEDLRFILAPMATNGEEPVGSMGTDTPLACLSDRPQPLFHYFKQLFAQVTNPAIDPIREELVMSLTSYIGTERNILDETPQHCHTLKLPIIRFSPTTTWRSCAASPGATSWRPRCRCSTASTAGEVELERAVEGLCRRASLAIKDGYTLLILSDRGIEPEYAADPQPAGAVGGASSPDPRGHAHAGGADRGVRRAARGHALQPADRLRRQRREPLSGHRDAGGYVPAPASSRSTLRRR